jgi:hypothetical protein
MNKIFIYDHKHEQVNGEFEVEVNESVTNLVDLLNKSGLLKGYTTLVIAKSYQMKADEDGFYSAVFDLGEEKSTVWQVKHNPWIAWVQGKNELRFPEDYECVAEVDSLDPDECFELTNTIDKPWYDNEKVTCRIQGRSTSVGDVVVIGGKMFLCLNVGWREYEYKDQIFKPGV